MRKAIPHISNIAGLMLLLAFALFFAKKGEVTANKHNCDRVIPCCNCADAEDAHEEKWATPDAQILCYGYNETTLPGDTINLYISSVSGLCDVYLIRLLPTSDTLETFYSVPAPLQTDNVHPHVNGCGWNTTLSYVLPTNIIPGLYVFHVKAGTRRTAWPFVVRNGSSESKTERIAFVLTTNTYHAYNDYRDTSLYVGGPAPYVNRQRPFLPAQVLWSDYGHIAYLGLFTADHFLASIITNLGYSIDYFTELDLHFGRISNQYSSIIFGSHSEYWSYEMLLNSKQYVKNGGHLIFLGGNNAYWKITMNEDGNLIECRKDYAFHDMDRTRGGLWSIVDPAFAITGFAGVYYDGKGFRTYAPYSIENYEHWVFDGTDGFHGQYFGLQARYDQFASGIETDKICSFTPSDFVILAHGQNPSGQLSTGWLYFPNDHADSSVNWNGGFIFTAGSMAFMYTLEGDAISRNILINLIEESMLRATRTERGVDSDEILFAKPLLSTAYPNPFNNKCQIKIQPYSIVRVATLTGRIIWQATAPTSGIVT